MRVGRVRGGVACAVRADAAVVRHDGGMTIPGLAPRGGFGAIVAVWVAGAVFAVAIGLLVPSDARGAWMPIGLAACILMAFVVQLRSGHPERFLYRVSASVLGALVVMGLVGLGLGLASLFTG